MIFLVSFTDVEDGKPPLAEPGGDLPIMVPGHEQADVVLDPDRVQAFELNEMGVSAHEVLEFALGRLVPRPERLVGVEEDERHHVSVELPGDVARLRDEGVVISEERAEDLANLRLADALSAP